MNLVNPVNLVILSKTDAIVEQDYRIFMIHKI